MAAILIHLLSALQYPAEGKKKKKRKMLLSESLVNQWPQTGLRYLLLTAQPDGMQRASFDVMRNSKLRQNWQL